MKSFLKRLGLVIILLLILFLTSQEKVLAKEGSYWEIQSVDTMKLSRDLARQNLNDSSFNVVIQREIKNISELGATHVAVGTPYDEELLPYLRRWVGEARKYSLNVWFRGNFSGWEGWFDYPTMSREEHILKARDFILNYPDLFMDGDIFTTCTECENGGAGDPRQTGDVVGFRNFLINEYEIASQAFRQIDKDVAVNYFSMNGDVANLIMDKATTERLGGIVVIDHYVETPSELYSDVVKISEGSGGKVILGEMGVPIPNIHGPMSDIEQETWLKEALVYLSKEAKLVGINYWVGSHGSTAIFDEDGNKRPAARVIASFFKPRLIKGYVSNIFGEPIKDVQINYGDRTAKSNEKGYFEIAIVPNNQELKISAQDYVEKTLDIYREDTIFVTLERERKDIIFKLRLELYYLVRRLKELI